MTGESYYFRKRFFGGFNTHDVVNYIAELAQERNELAEARAKAENETRALAHELEMLRANAEESKQKLMEDFERKVTVFKTAGGVFSEFEAVFETLRTELETAASALLADLEKTRGITTGIPPILRQAGEKFDGLRAAFGTEKSEEE